MWTTAKTNGRTEGVKKAKTTSFSPSEKISSTPSVCLRHRPQFLVGQISKGQNVQGLNVWEQNVLILFVVLGCFCILCFILGFSVKVKLSVSLL